MHEKVAFGQLKSGHVAKHAPVHSRMETLLHEWYMPDSPIEPVVYKACLYEAYLM